MNNIDFLPERYQERDLKRKAAVWQYALLVGFGGLLLAATLGQFAIKRSLAASLAELKQSRIDTKLKRDQVQLLKQQLGNKEEVAALYTYLQHPWPKTQILASITTPLSESIVLEGIEILKQQPNRPSQSGRDSRDDSDGPRTATTDLKELRSNNDPARVLVRVRGTVTETAALNEYVMQLGTSPLFKNVSLSSLQSQSASDRGSRSAFELLVILLPGHGQPGGPDGPVVERSKLAFRLDKGAVK